MVDHVAALSRRALVDDVANIESAPASITFSIGADPDHHPIRYADTLGFLGDHPYREDFAIVSKMEALLVEGHTYVSMLYTFRSSAKALESVGGKRALLEGLKIRGDAALGEPRGAGGAEEEGGPRERHHRLSVTSLEVS